MSICLFISFSFPFLFHFFFPPKYCKKVGILFISKLSSDYFFNQFFLKVNKGFIVKYFEINLLIILIFLGKILHTNFTIKIYVMIKLISNRWPNARKWVHWSWTDATLKVQPEGGGIKSTNPMCSIKSTYLTICFLFQTRMFNLVVILTLFFNICAPLHFPVISCL